METVFNLKTKEGRYMALNSGCIIENRFGVKAFKSPKGSYIAELGGVVDYGSILIDHDMDWQIYEPPAKPENKVIEIEYHGLNLNCSAHYSISGLGGMYNTENDAIRAAMEWIGEKARKVAFAHPDWFVPEDEGYRARLGRWGATELKGLELALLMRWPIEVLGEV